MRALAIREYPIEIKITDDKGNVEFKHATINEVLAGVSATFLSDVQLWLRDRASKAKERWKGLPVVVLYHGGAQFPPRLPVYVKGYEGHIHLINVDMTDKN